MASYRDGATAPDLASAVLQGLKTAVESRQHKERLYITDGHPRFYRVELARAVGHSVEEEAPPDIGKPLAAAIQRGFNAVGYEDSAVRLRYTLEPGSVGGTSPRLEFQMDTTLNEHDLIAAITKAEPSVRAAAEMLDQARFRKAATSWTR